MGLHWIHLQTAPGVGASAALNRPDRRRKDRGLGSETERFGAHYLLPQAGRCRADRRMVCRAQRWGVKGDGSEVVRSIVAGV
jgi:hypothetical protein